MRRSLSNALGFALYVRIDVSKFDRKMEAQRFLALLTARNHEELPNPLESRAELCWQKLPEIRTSNADSADGRVPPIL